MVELDDLVRFVEHPVRAFLRQRLGISVGDYNDEIDDALPVELDGLEKWGVGNRLLDGRLAGAAMDALRPAEIARGALPPGRLAPAGHRARAAGRRARSRPRRGSCSRATRSPARSTCAWSSPTAAAWAAPSPACAATSCGP